MRRNTVVRSVHDLGMAAWFGGSLMGAVGLNGAASAVDDRSERTRVANVGWSRWTPVNAAGIAAHLIGSAAVLTANKGRVVAQSGVGKSSTAKAALTAGAMVATAYSRALGKKLERAGDVPAEGSLEPGRETPEDVARVQRRLRVVQWVIPAMTGGLVVLNALHGEQQRPNQVFGGIARRVLGRG
ncbi:hypothetical protein ACWDUI_33550 [Streptosporangium sandarakinum]